MLRPVAREISREEQPDETSSRTRRARRGVTLAQLFVCMACLGRGRFVLETAEVGDARLASHAFDVVKLEGTFGRISFGGVIFGRVIVVKFHVIRASRQEFRGDPSPEFLELVVRPDAASFRTQPRRVVGDTFWRGKVFRNMPTVGAAVVPGDSAPRIDGLDVSHPGTAARLAMPEVAGVFVRAFVELFLLPHVLPRVFEC